MNRLHLAYIWLKRCCHSRGFGIQSPTDYSFVRYVINEHWPYYAYDQLAIEDNWLRQKVGRLCLRLANHRQPSEVIDLVGFADYLQAMGISQLQSARDLWRQKDLNPSSLQWVIPTHGCEYLKIRY